MEVCPEQYLHAITLPLAIQTLAPFSNAVLSRGISMYLLTCHSVFHNEGFTSYHVVLKVKSTWCKESAWCGVVISLWMNLLFRV